MARTHTDRRVTDPHGIPPVPADTDPPIPHQRVDRPVHDPWDPAYDPAARYAHDGYADPGYAQRGSAVVATPPAPHVDDPYTRHGGNGYARRTADEGGRRVQRRARSRVDDGPRRPRRAQGR